MPLPYYFATALLLDNVTIPSQCHIALPLWCFFPLLGYMFPNVMLVCHSCSSVTVVLPCQSCCLPVSCYSATMILLAAIIRCFHCWITLSFSCYSAAVILLYHWDIALPLSWQCCLATHAAAWPLMLLLSPCHNALPIMLRASFTLCYHCPAAC